MSWLKVWGPGNCVRGVWLRVPELLGFLFGDVGCTQCVVVGVSSRLLDSRMPGTSFEFGHESGLQGLGYRVSANPKP